MRSLDLGKESEKRSDRDEGKTLLDKATRKRQGLEQMRSKTQYIKLQYHKTTMGLYTVAKMSPYLEKAVESCKAQQDCCTTESEHKYTSKLLKLSKKTGKRRG